MWQIQTPPGLRGSETDPGLCGIWSAGGHDWVCRAAGGAAGITFGEGAATIGDGIELSVSNVGTEPMPGADEQYVCGDAWKVQFPQIAGQYSLRMSVRAVQATRTRVVWEPTFSIQTSLLDTDPSLELSASGTRDSSFPSSVEMDGGDVSVGVSAVRCGEGRGQLIVLLGPHDAPFTKDRCSAGRLDLRIFGEFLEKGVIRKTRPWIILDRSSEGVSAEDLVRYCEELCRTPLPLTA